MRELLHNPGFVRLWSSGILCGALRWLELLAIGLFVLERTGDEDNGHRTPLASLKNLVSK